MKSGGEQASVLIVDDNASLCRTAAFVLTAKGYAVTTALNGLQALERVRQSHFDMIFMDISMPLMDGVEACRRIRRIRPGAVVMMMTAYAVEELVQQALEKGACGILYKPLDMEEVIAVLQKI